LIGKYIAVPGLASLTWIKWGGAKELAPDDGNEIAPPAAVALLALQSATLT
jgi:hypothetical protein